MPSSQVSLTRSLQKTIAKADAKQFAKSLPPQPSSTCGGFYLPKPTRLSNLQQPPNHPLPSNHQPVKIGKIFSLIPPRHPHPRTFRIPLLSALNTHRFPLRSSRYAQRNRSEEHSQARNKHPTSSILRLDCLCFAFLRSIRCRAGSTLERALAKPSCQRFNPRSRRVRFPQCIRTCVPISATYPTRAARCATQHNSQRVSPINPYFLPRKSHREPAGNCH